MSKEKGIKVLTIATSPFTRGGVTSVLKAYEKSPLWKEFEMRWIATHRDSNKLVKLWYFFKSFIQALFYIPSYDIIHIHTSRPPSVLRKLPYILYARLWRKKVIVHLHFFETHVVFSPQYKRLYGFLCQLAHKIVVLSARCKREFASDIIPTEKMQVVYNPITTTISDIQYPRVQQILFAGLLTPLKGYKDLIDAFAIIAKRHPEWQLVLAGNGEIEQAQILAQQHNISSQVILPGWIDGDEKHRFFSQASIFCLPSYTEGFPMAVLDAWAYRLPVITTPVGGLPDVLVDEVNALVFEPGDVNTLSQQLERLITDSNLRNSIAEQSFQLSQTQFNIDTITDELKRLYINVINE